MKAQNRYQYLAGLIDGEGNIAIIRRERTRREGYSLRVTIYNTSLPLIKWIKQVFGGYQSTRDRGNPKHAISYQIVWNHAHAAKVVRGIIPFLVAKKMQAKIALRFQKQVSHFNPGRKGTSLTQLRLRRNLKKRINFLNRKGR